MNELTRRQIIALEMLKGLPVLISGKEDLQSEAICNALDFAEYFIDISEGDNE